MTLCRSSRISKTKACDWSLHVYAYICVNKEMEYMKSSASQKEVDLCLGFFKYLTVEKIMKNLCFWIEDSLLSHLSDYFLIREFFINTSGICHST